MARFSLDRHLDKQVQVELYDRISASTWFLLPHEAIELRDLLLEEFPVEPAQAEPWKCAKEPHRGDGYLHDAADDSPYDVDGLRYCGRCHSFLGECETHRMATPAQAEPTPEPDPDEVRRGLSHDNIRYDSERKAIDAAAHAWLRIREQQPTPPTPTIAQVIEACGAWRMETYRAGGQWFVRACDEARVWSEPVYADTPEAALAKLYTDAVERLRQQRDEADAKLAKLGVR